MPNRQIFQEPSFEDEGDSTVAWLGGMGQGVYTFWDLAQAFKIAGDVLVERVLAGDFEAYQIVYPVLYNYRHCLELYLKFFVFAEVGKKHELDLLLDGFEEYIRTHHGIEVPEVYRELVLEFNDFDKKSFNFRYPELVKSESTGAEGEFSVDLVSLRKKMDAFQVSFHRIVDADPNLHRGNLLGGYHLANWE